jgi:hypothetical protein
VCQDYDADGYLRHKAPITLLDTNPNLIPTRRWCQYCHQSFVDVDPKWSV